MPSAEALCDHERHLRLGSVRGGLDPLVGRLRSEVRGQKDHGAQVQASVRDRREEHRQSASRACGFEPAQGRPGLLVRADADGTRTIGRFVGRRFQMAVD